MAVAVSIRDFIIVTLMAAVGILVLKRLADTVGLGPIVSQI